MTPTLKSDHFRRRWRILPRVQLEIVRYIHYYHAGDRRFVWQVRIIYDTLRDPSVDTETGASTATQPLTPTPHASYPQPPRT